MVFVSDGVAESYFVISLIAIGRNIFRVSHVRLVVLLFDVCIFVCVPVIIFALDIDKHKPNKGRTPASCLVAVLVKRVISVLIAGDQVDM